MNRKLWINLFWKISVIFAVFVVLIFIANSTLLVSYFTHKQESVLAASSEKLQKLGHENTDLLDAVVWDMKEDHNFDVEIYGKDGRIIYSTGSPGIKLPGSGNFGVVHEEYEIIKSKPLADGGIIITARSGVTKEKYLICRRVKNGITTELRTQLSLLENSAFIAGEFIIIIAAICFVASLVWVFIFARKFSAPITEMSAITENMSKLDFSQKVKIEREDEIGKLGESINNMSDKLDTALRELRESNARLTDEIELERSLDVMRKAFVANVSHELKTPLSIISGYAEGLKLNINSDSKEEYCDVIIDEAERMNRLVLSILKLSKYESAQMPREPENFDISDMAEDMLKRLCGARSDLKYFCEIPKNTFIFADLSDTEQILNAYLENAVSHTAPGGTIKVVCNGSEKDIRISVFNTGEKIDPVLMPQIWQSFFRGDTARSRSEGRFGLGLSIVSAIVKSSGQSCGVYNTEDGVCFWFTAKRT